MDHCAAALQSLVENATNYNLMTGQPMIPGSMAQASNDINNLLVGTGIGTMFVDLHLRILRFTSPVTEIINVALG